MKMTLSSPNTANNERQTVNSDNKSLSPSSSPRSSPRPSPRPQTKREHTKSDTYLSVNYKESSSKNEGSPSSQEGSSSGRLSTELTPPPEIKAENPSLPKDRKEPRSKKKSWFNSLYPTYKSRSEDFKKIFKDVPDDERLVVDYSCALQKEILVHGRLYVSQNFLCFYANIFGWETNVTLKWKEVAAITKEKTALVIPNAVLICTKVDRLFFTSFVARDKTYLMLFRVWQNALMDQPMTTQEMWQWVHQCYGDELGLTSDDEDYIAPGTEEDKLLSARLSTESFSENECANTEAIIDSLIMEEQDEKIGNMESSKAGSEKSFDNHIPTDQSDNSESDVEKLQKKAKSLPVIPRNSSSLTLFTIPTTPKLAKSTSVRRNSKSEGKKIRCTVTHVGRQLVNEVMPLHIDNLFTLLFTSSKFYLDFHASRKTTDLTQTPWTHNPMDNSKSRVVSQTISLSNSMGPKSAQVTETQMMLPCSKAGHLYAIDVETVNAGVPYADSFIVLVHYCLKRVSDTQSSFTIHAQIKYKKSVWGLVKGMIEKNCWSGLDDFFAALIKALRAESKGYNVPEKRKAIRKRKISAGCPRPIESPGPIVSGRKKTQPPGIFRSDVVTIIVFIVLLVLVFLNVMLYIKLWSLEETPPYTIDLQILQNLPKSHEEWIDLLQKQETLHSVEVKKWQKILKTAVSLLKQAEESLTELQLSIYPSASKVFSLMKNENGVSEKEDL